MPGRTWILVADAAHARVLEMTPDPDPPNVVHDLEHPASRLKGSELMADDRGRARPPSRVSQHGAAMDYRTSPRQVEAQRFARELGDLLRLAHARNEYSELILVASPSFLGDLRGVLTDAVARSVTASVAKDYTDERPEDVVRLVESAIRDDA